MYFYNRTGEVVVLHMPQYFFPWNNVFKKTLPDYEGRKSSTSSGNFQTEHINQGNFKVTFFCY